MGDHEEEKIVGSVEWIEATEKRIQPLLRALMYSSVSFMCKEEAIIEILDIAEAYRKCNPERTADLLAIVLKYSINERCLDRVILMIVQHSREFPTQITKVLAPSVKYERDERCNSLTQALLTVADRLSSVKTKPSERGQTRD